MDQDQQRSLHILGTDFTTNEAVEALDWTGSRRALVAELRGLSYSSLQRHRRGDTHVSKIWRAPPHPVSECSCRCHTGTCGANDMVLAERTLRLIITIRPIGADGMQAIADLVDRAGVDFAREAIGLGDLDDDVPF
jgi:hypothetical protein